MALTFKNLQDEVLDAGFSSSQYLTYVKRWLNEAQRYVMAQTDLRGQEDLQTITTTATDNTYTLDADFLRMIHVADTETDDLLQGIAQAAFDDLDSTNTGRPQLWTVTVSTLYLYPTPDGAYSLTLRYYKSPPDLSADGDIPQLPEMYCHLMVSYALQRAYRRENDYEAAAFHRAEFERDLMKAKTEVHHDTFDFPRQVPGAWPHQALDPSTWR